MGPFFLVRVGNMSSELTWQLIRKHNCFITRRDGATFTSEPNNLMNKHAFKWSGLANKDAVGVDFNRDANGNVTKGCVLSTKSRKSSLRRQPAKTWNRTTFKTSDFRFVFFSLGSNGSLTLFFL